MFSIPHLIFYLILYKLFNMNIEQGQLIANRYILQKELGRGGMAIVYIGMDTILNRNVAIKILYPQFASDSNLIQRFFNEARIIAKLKYKSIVSIYDVSEYNGVPFIVLEYIHGYDLRQLQNNLSKEGKRLSLEMSLVISFIVCDAISHAHSMNIIHRDIKPENVLISDMGEIKITDFGLAHLLTDNRITMTGTAIGSPEFMSPEHINSKNIDKHSDVFSLGSLLYWLITQTSPFYANNTMSILNNITRNSYSSIDKVIPWIDRWIKDIITICLSPEPEKRYSDATQLCHALHEAIQRFTEDPYATFKQYINSPAQIENKILNRHNNARYKDALNYIQSNNPEKALSIINTLLETDKENKDISKLIRAIKQKRYIRWVISMIELIIMFSLIFVIAHEDYREPSQSILNYSIEPGLSFNGTKTEKSNSLANGSEKSAPLIVNIKPKVTAMPEKKTTSKKNIPKKYLISSIITNTTKQSLENGTLEIITYPWAMIFIDDRYVGETPRLKNISLTPGEHTINVMNPYLKPYKTVVYIIPNRTITKRINLNEQ